MSEVTPNLVRAVVICIFADVKERLAAGHPPDTQMGQGRSPDEFLTKTNIYYGKIKIFLRTPHR